MHGACTVIVCDSCNNQLTYWGSRSRREATKNAAILGWVIDEPVYTCTNGYVYYDVCPNCQSNTP